jgi:hypothetical protein
MARMKYSKAEKLAILALYGVASHCYHANKTKYPLK